MRIGQQNVLRLSREVDNYGLYIVWNPKTKHIAGYNMEYDELCDIAPFDTFMQDAAGYTKKWLFGDICR